MPFPESHTMNNTSQNNIAIVTVACISILVAHKALVRRDDIALKAMDQTSKAMDQSFKQNDVIAKLVDKLLSDAKTTETQKPQSE